jgi:hypothetical protein
VVAVLRGQPTEILRQCGIRAWACQELQAVAAVRVTPELYQQAALVYLVRAMLAALVLL